MLSLKLNRKRKESDHMRLVVSSGDAKVFIYLGTVKPSQVQLLFDGDKSIHFDREKLIDGKWIGKENETT